MTQRKMCQCSDRLCRECGGQCNQVADTTLYRADIRDTRGTHFCERCADDAASSQIPYTEEPSDVELESI
jgi:hypothetical protein